MKTPRAGTPRSLSTGARICVPRSTSDRNRNRECTSLNAVNIVVTRPRLPPTVSPTVAGVPLDAKSFLFNGLRVWLGLLFFLGGGGLYEMGLYNCPRFRMVDDM